MTAIIRLVLLGCGLSVSGYCTYALIEEEPSGSLLLAVLGTLLFGLLEIFSGFPLWTEEGLEVEKEKKTKIWKIALIPILLLVIIGSVGIYTPSDSGYTRTTYVSNPDKPYYGMSESQISRTKLGMYDKYMKDKVFDGEYDYIWEDSNGKTLFKARVKKGVVVGISEFSGSKSDKPASTKAPVTSSVGKTSKPAATSKPKTSKSVAGYYSPEDFYYDHPDDFFDFEEAEEYYYDHGGL